MGVNYKRKAGKIEPGKSFGIFTEGEVTEKEYFKGLCSMIRYPDKLVDFRSSVHSDPKGLVDDAVEAKKINEKKAKRGKEGLIDEWIVIVDTEGDRPNMDQAINKAIANDIILLISDLSFEYWLLLHFENTTRNFTNVNQLISELGKHMDSYKTNNKHVDMKLLFPQVSDALRNSAIVRKNLTSQEIMSPRTDCDIFAYYLMKTSPNVKMPSDVTYRDKNDLSMYRGC